MSNTSRELVSTWWNDAWKEGLWAAAWSKSIEDLTAAQAAWQPPSAPGVAGRRHSIWQMVLHMCFWRDNELRRLSSGVKPTPEEVAELNFPEVTDASEAAWKQVRARFAESQAKVAAALADPKVDTDRMKYLLPHDAYHFGQVNYVRAMLGLKAIE